MALVIPIQQPRNTYYCLHSVTVAVFIPLSPYLPPSSRCPFFSSVTPSGPRQVFSTPETSQLIARFFYTVIIALLVNSLHTTFQHLLFASLSPLPLVSPAPAEPNPRVPTPPQVTPDPPSFHPPHLYQSPPLPRPTQTETNLLLQAALITSTSSSYNPSLQPHRPAHNTSRPPVVSPLAALCLAR